MPHRMGEPQVSDAIASTMKEPAAGSPAICWPEVTELRDILIAPLVYGSTKGHMTVHADPASPLLNHYRYGEPDSILDVLPFGEAAEAPLVVEEPIIYGGLMFRHFGHAIAEGIHRLWPRFAVKELHGAKVAFNVLNNVKIMPYVSEALNLHGISRKDVIPIQQPTLFKRLFVGAQARQMAGPTLFSGYRTMLDRDHSRRLPVPNRQRRLYISRLHHHHTGSYYGESFVEAELAAQGFEIVYPEKITLTELVIALRDSRVAVFAEGSAIHALELCGSLTPAVYVIGRRPLSFERFSKLLDDVCSKWRVGMHWVDSDGMSPDVKKHSSVLNLRALMNDIWAFAGRTPSGQFNAEHALDSIRRDLAAHIEDERHDRVGDYDAKARRLEDRIAAIARAALNS